MGEKSRNDIIDHFKRVIDNGECSIDCGDCILHDKLDKCYDAVGIATAFLTAIELDEWLKITPNAEKFPCYQCGNPRGKTKLGAYITPCPHCGDEIPF